LNSELGKLVAVHSTSPAFLQRAAIVAALSFLFFLVALIFYLVWQSFLYFVLATGFLIVQIFTMTGWWMQKRKAVNIYANGLEYRSRTLRWSEIEKVERRADQSLEIVPNSGESVVIPSSLQDTDRIESFVRSQIG